MANNQQHKELPKKQIRHVQSIAGSFLCYRRALDFITLTALNGIGTTQAKPAKCTKEKCQQLMDCAAIYLNAIVRCCASDIALFADSDAAYLALPKARSRISGCHYLSSIPPIPEQTLTLNAPILVACRTLQHVASSAAKAETAGVFTNAQIALPMRCALE